MSEFQCKACKVRGQTWSGSAPKCHFREDGSFTKEGWNCATANCLRELMETEGNYRARRDDESIGLLYVPEKTDENGNFLRGCFWVLGRWYKERGRTDGLFVIGLGADTATPTMLTLNLAEIAIELCGDKEP